MFVLDKIFKRAFMKKRHRIGQLKNDGKFDVFLVQEKRSVQNGIDEDFNNTLFFIEHTDEVINEIEQAENAEIQLV
jgi:hypothetical protein